MSDHDLQRLAEEMAAAAERDPVGHLTYHEGLRLYGDRDRSSGGERPEQDLERAVDDGDADAMVELGLRRERAGEIEGAIAAYREASAAGSAYAEFRLGFAHEVHGHDLESALDHYLRADAADDVDGAGNAGRLLKEKGDLLAAERAFGRCFERGGTRALSDHAGLMSHRADATPEEIRDVVAKLCSVEDIWVEAEARKRSGGSDADLNAANRRAGPPMAVFSGMWSYCDPAAMEAGVVAADQAGSAAGAYHVGIALRERGAHREAAQASTRAGERGYPAGWTNAAVSLNELGDSAGAEQAARKGGEMGEAGAFVLLGLILDQRGDRRGSIEANRRADAMGHKDGAFHLGIDLMKERQFGEAEGAFERALERGEPKAAESLQMLRSMSR